MSDPLPVPPGDLSNLITELGGAYGISILQNIINSGAYPPSSIVSQPGQDTWVSVNDPGVYAADATIVEAWNGNELAKHWNYGNPNGVIQAVRTGESCYDPATPALWIAASLGSAAQVPSNTNTFPVTIVEGVNDLFNVNLPGYEAYSQLTIQIPAGTYATPGDAAEAINATLPNPTPVAFTGTYDGDGMGCFASYAGSLQNSWSITDVNGGAAAIGFTENPNDFLYGTDSTWENVGSAPGVHITRAFPFNYAEAGLSTGLALYTPTPGDILHNAWIEIDTAWDGTTPMGDYSNFTEGNAGYAVAIGGAGAIDMTLNDIPIGTSALAGDVASSLAEFDTLQVASAFTSQVGGGALVYPTQLPVSRWCPLKILTDEPFTVWVTQDGAKGGADPGSTQGAAILYLVTSTPA